MTKLACSTLKTLNDSLSLSTVGIFCMIPYWGAYTKENNDDERVSVCP